MKKYFAEFFGTMFLVLLACGSAVLAGGYDPTTGVGGNIGVLGVGLCFGLVLICLCYAIGGISGCHVNPAVSLGVFLTDSNFSFKDMIAYWVAQLCGAAVGAALLFWLMDFGLFGQLGYAFGGITGDVSAEGSYLATNVLQHGATWYMALLTEILLTMFFVFVVLGATSKFGVSNLAGLAIGIALGLVNIVGIPVDNCSVNPARSFGPALFAPNAWGDFWIMVVGPLAGAILAAFIFRCIAPNAKSGEAKV